MKKLNLMIFAFLILGGGITKAQYNNVLLNFDTANGLRPYGSLTFYAHKLYGMTYLGGAYNAGCIFRIDTDGSEYQDLHDFNDTSGGHPYGSLIFAENKMYGMSSGDGFLNYGNVFSIDTDRNEYKDLFDFNYTDGANPEGNLTLIGNRLYGMTTAPSFIFSIDTNGNRFKELYAFTDSGGINPLGSLTLSGGTFYGMTTEGGIYGLHNGAGTVFSIDTNGTGFTDMHNFRDSIGGNPMGSLTVSGNKLFGMTWTGGCIFSINTNGSSYKYLHIFSNRDSGWYPTGSLTLSGSTLYGFANGGGSLEGGCIFKIDTSGNGYTDLLYFDGYNGGGQPGGINARWGSLIVHDYHLYGMTPYGGPYGFFPDDCGVIFAVDTNSIASINNLKTTSGKINIFPNPSTGIFTLSLSNINARPDESFGREKCNIEIYNVIGEKVLTETLRSTQGDNRIDLSNQPNGVYFYRVVSENREVAGEGKVIIQK